MANDFPWDEDDKKLYQDWTRTPASQKRHAFMTFKIEDSKLVMDGKPGRGRPGQEPPREMHKRFLETLGDQGPRWVGYHFWCAGLSDCIVIEWKVDDLDESLRNSIKEMLSWGGGIKVLAASEEEELSYDQVVKMVE